MKLLFDLHLFGEPDTLNGNSLNEITTNDLSIFGDGTPHGTEPMVRRGKIVEHKWNSKALSEWSTERMTMCFKEIMD